MPYTGSLVEHDFKGIFSMGLFLLNGFYASDTERAAWITLLKIIPNSFNNMFI